MIPATSHPPRGAMFRATPRRTIGDSYRSSTGCSTPFYSSCANVKPFLNRVAADCESSGRLPERSTVTTEHDKSQAARPPIISKDTLCYFSPPARQSHRAQLYLTEYELNTIRICWSQTRPFRSQFKFLGTKSQPKHGSDGHSGGSVLL